MDTLTVEQSTPMATITAEMNQNAAGAWRGSVKVSVTGPFTFDTFLDHERTPDEALAATDVGDGTEIVQEVDVVSWTDAADYNRDDPSAFISVPTEEELALRSAVGRLLTDASLRVYTQVEYFNSKNALADKKTEK
jgi:hypothetical protein